MPRRLIVTADDFGHAPEIDEAIAALADLGRLAGTSCLVRAPRWAAAAPLARALRGTLDLGLHFDLTAHDRLAPLGRLAASSLVRGIDARAVRARLRAQLARFEDDVGAAPDHLDGHQHVHQFRGIAAVVVEELAHRYGTRAPWVRVSRPAAAGPKGHVIAALGAGALARLLDAAGLRHNGRLLGVYDFAESPPYEARLGRWLQVARDGDALMVHPAVAPMDGDGPGKARRLEYLCLASERFPASLACAGITVARGSDCLAVAA